MKHTPGPWKNEELEYHNDNRKGQLVVSRDGIFVADCRISDHYKKEEEKLANALLIAAAPELLEACRIALANLTPKYAGEHLVIKSLRAAIAKAEGR